MIKSIVLEMFIINKGGVENWIVVILRFYIFKKNMDIMVYKLFDFDKRFFILFNIIYINYIRGFFFISLCFCYLKIMSLNSNYVVILFYE